MFIYILIIIPIIATIISFVWFKHQVVWWEYLLNFGIALICIFASKAIIEHTQTSDTEYLGGWTTEVRHYEDWNERVSCRHPKYCTRRTTDSKGHSTTQRYQCGWQHLYDVDYHPEYWNLKGSNDESINISQAKYNELVNQFGTGKNFVDLNRNYHTNDGDMYTTKWDGDLEKLEAITTPHKYENRVRVSSSTFAMEEPPEEIFEEYNLFHYPKIYDGYKQQAILGYDDADSEKLMQIINSTLGRKYEFRSYIMIFKGHGREAGMYQEEQWQGGNKNELNITIGIDENENVKWCHVFSWTDERGIVVDIKHLVESQDNLDLKEIITSLPTMVEKGWVRKDFEDFAYLSVEPETYHIVIAFIITLIINGLVTWYVVANDVTEEHNYLYNKRR